MAIKSNNPSARTRKLFLKLSKIARETSSTASAETVHDLRTTARRVETLLSAHGMDDHGSGAKLARQLAKLRRRAGKLRDVDVHIAALDSIRLDNGIQDRALLHDHLAELRTKGEKKLVRTLGKQVSKGLAKRLKRAVGELEQQRDESSAHDFTAQALDKFKRISEQYTHFTDKNLHNFRVDCKRIRYLAEISPESKTADRVISSLKNIQDAIGDWHDWLTLREMAKDVLPNTASSLMAALRTQTTSKFNEAVRVTEQGRTDLLAIRTEPATEPAETPHSESERKGPESARGKRPGKGDIIVVAA